MTVLTEFDTAVAATVDRVVASKLGLIIGGVLKISQNRWCAKKRWCAKNLAKCVHSLAEVFSGGTLRTRYN